MKYEVTVFFVKAEGADGGFMYHAESVYQQDDILQIRLPNGVTNFFNMDHVLMYTIKEKKK